MEPPSVNRLSEAALRKAAEIRMARAELKAQLKAGKITLGAVLQRADSDDVVGRLKVSAVLQALPGVGKIRAMRIMERLKIADGRRLRGLGDQQRKALLAIFADESLAELGARASAASSGGKKMTLVREFQPGLKRNTHRHQHIRQTPWLRDSVRKIV